MNQKETLTRKEISALTPLSEFSICKKERKLKLNHCRVPHTSRPVLYWRDKAIACLTEAGLIATKQV